MEVINSKSIKNINVILMGSKLCRKGDIHIIYLINEFLGYKMAYKWNKSNISKCLYCSCPVKKAVYCGIPFLCEWSNEVNTIEAQYLALKNALFIKQIADEFYRITIPLNKEFIRLSGTINCNTIRFNDEEISNEIIKEVVFYSEPVIEILSYLLVILRYYGYIHTREIDYYFRIILSWLLPTPLFIYNEKIKATQVTKGRLLDLAFNLASDQDDEIMDEEFDIEVDQDYYDEINEEYNEAWDYFMNHAVL